jgi:hypothetical protein
MGARTPDGRRGSGNEGIRRSAVSFWKRSLPERRGSVNQPVAGTGRFFLPSPPKRGRGEEEADSLNRCV